MKNSPDPEWFNNVEKRLAGYAEEPDADLWNMISASVHGQREPGWARWFHRGSVVMMLLVFMWTGKHSVIDSQPQLTKEDLLEESRDKSLHQSPLGSDPVRYKNSMGDESKTLVRAKEDAPKDQARMSVSAIAIKNVGKISVEKQSDATWLSIMKQNEVAIFDSLQADELTSQPVPAPNKKTIIPQRKRSPWSFYFSVSPSLSFQKLLPLKGDGVVIEGSNPSPVFSANRLGWGFQAGVQSKIARRLEFYGGISFYHQSQTLVYRYLSEDAVTTSQREEFEYTLSPGTLEKSVKYAMLNAGAEAGLIYHLHGDNLAHKFGGGISWQHGVRQASSGESYDNRQSQYVFYQIFYRNEYALGNSVRIYVQPFFRRSIVARETLQEPFKIKPYQAGLSMGLVFHHR